MNNIQSRFKRLEETIGVRNIQNQILKNCKRQLQQNPESTISIELDRTGNPCIIIQGSNYPENFVDEIENAIEDFDLYSRGAKVTGDGYCIKLGGIN